MPRRVLHLPSIGPQFVLPSLGVSCIVWLGCLGGLAGCGGSSAPKLYPVEGVVRHQGQPAVGARITFVPKDEALNRPGMPTPSAIVGDDGVFHLLSYGGQDGAPAGSYAVTIEWKAESQESDPENQEAVPDRLEGKYQTADTTILSATVEAKPNQLPPFELK